MLGSMTIVARGDVAPFCFERVDRLDPDRQVAVAELLRAVIAADGHRGVGANVLEVLAEPGGGTAILAGDGRLDGLAFCRPTGDGHTWDIELTVRPDRRGNGLGGALLTLAIEAIPAGADLRVWAYRPGVPQRRLAARHGLAPALHLLQLRGATATAAAVRADPPPGVRLRTAVEGDVHGVVVVQNAAFTTEQVSEHEVRTRLARPNMGPDHLVIADAGGTVAGFCWMAGPRPDGEGGDNGELVLLAVHPDHHGGGLGKALTVAGMALLHGLGVEGCMIYADAANEHAVRLYRKLGFRVHHTDVALTRDGTLPWPAEPTGA
jgi:mycothiol synthase